MGLDLPLTPDQLPEAFRDYKFVSAKKAWYVLPGSIIDGDQLSDDMLNIFRELENPSEPTRILVDLGNFDLISNKGFNCLLTSLKMVAQNGGEIVLAGVSGRVRKRLETWDVIKNEEFPSGFRLVNLTASGGVAKEK